MKNDLENSKRLLRFSEACKYMGISKPILNRLIQAGLIGQVDIDSNNKRFDKEELDEDIIKKKVFN